MSASHQSLNFPSDSASRSLIVLVGASSSYDARPKNVAIIIVINVYAPIVKLHYYFDICVIS